MKLYKSESGWKNVGILLLVTIAIIAIGCDRPTKKERIKNSIERFTYKVKVDGMDCVIVTTHSDQSGMTGITCDWK